MADTSKQCALTNDSSKDVVVTLAVPPDETTSDSASVKANGTIEILKTTDGATVISSGGTDTVTLATKTFNDEDKEVENENPEPADHYEPILE
jgi:hypothetical protein